MDNEPVAWHYPGGKPDQCTTDKAYAEKDPAWTPMYYKHEFVGLTDEQIWLEYQRFWPFHPAEEPTLAKDIAKFARAIEAKLKENT